MTTFHTFMSNIVHKLNVLLESIRRELVVAKIDQYSVNVSREIKMECENKTAYSLLVKNK